MADKTITADVQFTDTADVIWLDTNDVIWFSSRVLKDVTELRFYNRSGTLVRVISSRTKNFPLIDPGLEFQLLRDGGCGAFKFIVSEDLSLDYNYKCEIYLWESRWFTGFITKIPKPGTSLTYKYEGWGYGAQMDWQTINETYTAKELSAIAESILDDYLVPNTDIEKEV